MQYLSGLELAKRDPDWTKKIALCGVLMLSAMCIPFFGQFALNGYLSAMMQRTARGQEDLLPRMEFDLDYLMKLAGSGFRVFIVQLVWGLALLPIMLVCYGCIGAGAFLGAQLESSLISGVLAGLGGLLMIACMIPFSLGMVSGGVRAQLSDDISVGLQFGPAFRMGKTMWKELLLGGFILSFVFFGLYLAGIIACGIGMFFTIPLAMIIMSNYYAHVYREYVARGGEAVNIAHIREADPQGSSVGPRPQAF